MIEKESTQLQQGEKKENSSGWSEKRKELLEEIDARVKLVLGLNEFAEKNEEKNSEEFRRMANDKARELGDFFGEDIYEKYDEYKKMMDEYSSMCEERDNKFMSICGESKSLEPNLIDRIENETRELSEKILEMSLQVKKYREKNPDVVFFCNSIIFLQNLFRKKYQAESSRKTYKRSPKKFFRQLSKNEHRELAILGKKKKTISKVDFSGYGVELFVDPNEYEKEVGDSLGTHFKNSVFTVIKDEGGEETDATIKHERNHNLMECFSPDDVADGQGAVEIIGRILDGMLAREKDREENIKEIKEAIEEMIPSFAFNNFAEIGADFEELENGEISTYFTYCSSSLVGFEISAFNLYNKDEEVSKELAGAVRKLEKNYLKIFNKLSNIFFIAKRFNVLDEAKAAIVLFKLKEIDKVEKYLKYKVGEDQYDAYQSLKPLILGKPFFKIIAEMKEEAFTPERKAAFSEGKEIVTDFDWLLHRYVKENEIGTFFSSENLTKLLKALEKNRLKLSDEDREQIEKSVEQEDLFVPMGLRKLEEGERLEGMYKLGEALWSIGDKTGLDVFKRTIGKKIFMLSVSVLEDCIRRENFSELNNFFEKFKLLEKYFKDYSDLIIKFAISDYLKYHSEKYDKKSLLEESEFGKRFGSMFV